MIHEDTTATLATSAPPVTKRLGRFFTLTWVSTNPFRKPGESQNATGCIFAENGYVALSNGMGFDTLDDLKYTLKAATSYTLHGEDGLEL